MKSICNKCQWHHIKNGSTTDWRAGIVTHNVDIDACIHPILDNLNETDHNGQRLYHVEICSKRNKNNNCKYFQPSMGLFKTIIAYIKDKKWIDIYNDYELRQKK